MPLKRLNAFALGNDDRDALVVNLLADDAGNLGHVLGQGNHHMQVLRFYTKTEADSLKLIGTGTILTACHSGSEVVGDNNGDVSFLVYGIQEAGHTAVSEGRVTNDSYCRPLTGIRGALGHSDASSHIHTRMNSTVRRQEAQRITTDITKDTGILVLLQHLVKGSVNIAVTAALTQLWRTSSDDVALLE